MKYKWILFTAAMCVAACYAKPDAGAYAKPDFDTYQPILDRMPFGAPPDPNAVQPPTLDALKEKREQEMLARQIHMSAVNIMPDGRTAIGFTDISAKPPVHLLLHVGESSDGWTVIDADYDEETATIKKGTTEVALKLGKGLIEPPALDPRGRPALMAANQGVNAGMQINAMMPPLASPVTAPSFAGAGRSGVGVAETPGLRRETRPIPNTAGRTTAYPSAATPTTTPSYTELRDQRLKAEQTEKEKADEEQKKKLERLAAAAAQEAIRIRERENAEAAEDQGFVDDVDE